MTREQKRIARLMWRAGFGARHEEIVRRARVGVPRTVSALLRPKGRAYSGPRRVEGKKLKPKSEWGDAQLWWLDRAVRTRHPLAERMVVNWHDHFATRADGVPGLDLMMRQYWTFRRHAFGSFRALTRAMVTDHAMQHFLSLANSSKEEPNENFARELFELFTLGANNGYTERDIREASRALTGFVYDWQTGAFGYEPDNHDDGVKTIFGKTGRFTPMQVVDLAIDHPRHAEFICRKLWGYFSPHPPPRPLLRKLIRTYRTNGTRTGPVIRRILTSGAFYRSLDAPDMIKPPFVYAAGMLRLTKGRVDSRHWVHLLEQMGQMPFYPPNVAGWGEGEDWISTNATMARFDAGGTALRDRIPEGSIPRTENARQAVARARRACGRPWTSSRTDAAMLSYAKRAMAGRADQWQHYQAERQIVLRHMLIAGPDAHVC